MKKLLFLFSFLSVFTFGQGHYFGFNGGYTYSSANILSGTSGEMGPQHLYFGELNYQYFPNKWFYFNIGVRYDRKGFDLNNEPILSTTDDITSNIDTIGNYSYDFHKVGVPIKVGFKLGGKFFFVMAAGLIPSYSILSQANWTPELQGNGIEPTSWDKWTNIKNFELAWIGEIGIGGQLGENILLTFTGGYSQSLTKHLLPMQTLNNGVLTEDYRTARFKGIHGAIGMSFRLQKKEKKKKLEKYSPSTN